MNTEQRSKVTVTEDKMANSIEMNIRDETHTLGNALVSELLLVPNVSFAAYKIPHPLQNLLKVKVSLKEGAEEHPLERVKSTIERLIGECDSLQASLSLYSKE